MTIRQVVLEYFVSFLSSEKFYGQYGKAINVDAEKRTCDFVPAGDDATRTQVRLQALIGEEKGFVIVPKENSDVAVVFVNKNKAFVVKTSAVEQIIYQGGDNGGLINIEDIVTKLNNLEDAHNGLVSSFNAHTHVVPQAPTGATTSAPTLPSNTDVLIPTQTKELEDNLFLH